LDENGRSLDRPVTVRLLSGNSNVPITEAFSNDAGMTEFNGLRQGTYHVTVAGEGIEAADSGELEVDSRKSTQFVFITVRRSAGAWQNVAAHSDRYSVSATSLKVPSGAHKEFAHAAAALAK